MISSLFVCKQLVLWVAWAPPPECWVRSRAMMVCVQLGFTSAIALKSNVAVPGLHARSSLSTAPCPRPPSTPPLTSLSATAHVSRPAANFSGSGYERNQNGTSALTTAWAQPSGLALAPSGDAIYVAGAHLWGEIFGWAHGVHADDAMDAVGRGSRGILYDTALTVGLRSLSLHLCRQRVQLGAPPRLGQRRQPAAGGRGPHVLRQPLPLWRQGRRRSVQNPRSLTRHANVFRGSKTDAQHRPCQRSCAHHPMPNIVYHPRSGAYLPPIAPRSAGRLRQRCAAAAPTGRADCARRQRCGPLVCLGCCYV